VIPAINLRALYLTGLHRSAFLGHIVCLVWTEFKKAVLTEKQNFNID
jgi:hypothetical protein